MDECMKLLTIQLHHIDNMIILIIVVGNIAYIWNICFFYSIHHHFMIMLQTDYFYFNFQMQMAFLSHVQIIHNMLLCWAWNKNLQVWEASVSESIGRQSTS